VRRLPGRGCGRVAPAPPATGGNGPRGGETAVPQVSQQWDSRPSLVSRRNVRDGPMQPRTAQIAPETWQGQMSAPRQGHGIIVALSTPGAPRLRMTAKAAAPRPMARSQ
jgi:hypothetical protein